MYHRWRARTPHWLLLALPSVVAALTASLLATLLAAPTSGAGSGLVWLLSLALVAGAAAVALSAPLIWLIWRAWRVLDHAMQRQSAEESQARQLMVAISRDLRTPLCSLQAMLEAMADGVVTDAATLRRYQREARTQARRLTALVDQLLARAQVETMESLATTLRREPTDLGDLATHALERARAHGQRMGVSISLRMDEPTPLASVDAEEIGAILDRLLRNAIRHTPAGGAVVAHLATVVAADDRADGPREALFQVIDTGDGIPASRLHSLFAAPRHEGAAQGAGGSTGFGLSLAARVAQAHGGRMWAESPLPKDARLLIAPDASDAPRDPRAEEFVGAVISLTLPISRRRRLPHRNP